MRPRSARRGYTLLEVFLVLIITGVLIAAIASAINIHLRVSEVGRTEVEQAQLARAILGRIAGDIRNAVPHIEPVESAAGATSDDIASAAASASSALGGTGTSGATSASSSSGGGTTSGSAASGSSGSGAQTLQPLKTLSTLSTLKPQSASSSSSGTSSGAAGGYSAGNSSSGGSSSTTSAESESTAETTPVKPPGIYGDQYTLQVDVSRIRRPGTFTPIGISGDAPGDVKTVSYELVSYPGSPEADGFPALGLYRRSIDRAAANFNASAGSSATDELQLIAGEVASLEYRYFDGTTWQTSWDSSGGTLPTAVEIAITLQAPATAAISSSESLTLPQVYRLTVAIPAAQSSGSSTDASTDDSTSSSSETTP